MQLNYLIFFRSIYYQYSFNSRYHISSMEKYKVKSPEDGKVFVVTRAYQKLYQKFRNLKKEKGRIIHVIGSPGTGKSANIYSALNNLDLNIYDAILLMDGVEKSSREVFKEFFTTLKDDLGVESDAEVYQKASEFDAVLFADKFHDSQFLDESKVGLSMWTDYKSIKSFPFYLLCIIEYVKHRKALKKVNIIIQTAWTVRIKGVKYDLFTDFSILSRIMAGMLKLFFEVVEISYSESETIKIVKHIMGDVEEDQIRLCIEKYGCKPRFICTALEKESLNTPPSLNDGKNLNHDSNPKKTKSND